MSRQRARAFGLIEALIALVVLVTGLGVAVKFFATAVRDAGGDLSLSVAVGLAQEKLEDLREYEVLPTTAGKVAYQDIAGNAGGRLASGGVSLWGVGYTRTWAVTSWYFPLLTEGMATTTVPTPAPPHPDFKQATVTVTWRDDKNDMQTVTLTSMIPRIDPTYSRRALAYP